MFIKTNFFYPVVLHYVTVFSVCFFVSMENIIALSCSRAATSLVSAWKSAMTVHSCRAEASARTASTQSECTETERKCYTTTHTHSNTLLIWLPVSMEVQYWVIIYLPLCVNTCLCSWVMYEEPNFRGRMYIVERGNYCSHNEWQAQNPNIQSIRRVVNYF